MTLKLACADFAFPLLPHDHVLDLIAALCQERAQSSTVKSVQSSLGSGIKREVSSSIFRPDRSRRSFSSLHTT